LPRTHVTLTLREVHLHIHGEGGPGRVLKVSLGVTAAYIVLLVVAGLRDKTVFLAARGEQYLPALLFFTILPFVDMIIALTLLIVVVWVSAGVSKFGRHFANVVPRW